MFDMRSDYLIQILLFSHSIESKKYLMDIELSQMKELMAY